MLASDNLSFKVILTDIQKKYFNKGYFYEPYPVAEFGGFVSCKS